MSQNDSFPARIISNDVLYLRLISVFCLQLTSVTRESRETLDREEEQMEESEVLYHSALLRFKRSDDVSLAPSLSQVVAPPL